MKVIRKHWNNLQTMPCDTVYLYNQLFYDILCKNNMLCDWPWWLTTSHPSSTTSPDLTSSGVSSSPPKSRRVIVLNITSFSLSRLKVSLSLSSFQSLFSRKLGCYRSLYLLKTRTKLAHMESHIHVHTLMYTSSNPSLTVWEWVRDPSCIIIFQNSSNLGQLTRLSNDVSCYTVGWIIKPTPQDFHC